MAWIVKNNGSTEWRGPNSIRVEFQMQNDATGEIKRERKTFRVSGHTQKERGRCLREFRNELESGVDRGKRFTTFAEYAADWLKQREADPQIAPRTVARDRGRVANINITFGNYRIAAITRQDVKNFQAAIMTADENGKAPTASGKPLSGTTARGIRTTLHQILEEAVEDKIISENPCSKVKAPKVDTAERKHLSKERIAEFRALLDASTPRPSLVGFRLCLFAGLRRGEACAVTWNDFNEEEGTITVRRTLCTETLKFKAPKTEAGYRTIPLDAATVRYLARFRKIQAEKLIRLGKPIGDHCIVAKAECEFMHPENLTRSLARFGKANGFEGITPHLLRHSYCSMLFETGTDVKVAQHHMGHDDARTTLNVYTHYEKERGKKTAAAIDKLMDSLPTTNIVQLDKPTGRWGVMARSA